MGGAEEIEPRPDKWKQLTGNTSAGALQEPDQDGWGPSVSEERCRCTQRPRRMGRGAH
jgi:hypothetical protein